MCHSQVNHTRHAERQEGLHWKLTGRNSCKIRAHMCQRMHLRQVYKYLPEQTTLPRLRTSACSKLCGERCIAICTAMLLLSTCAAAQASREKEHARRQSGPGARCKRCRAARAARRCAHLPAPAGTGSAAPTAGADSPAHKPWYSAHIMGVALLTHFCKPSATLKRRMAQEHARLDDRLQVHQARQVGVLQRAGVRPRGSH